MFNFGLILTWKNGMVNAIFTVLYNTNIIPKKVFLTN